jgi:hypothetical protein
MDFCKDIAVVPQFTGTCWFNAILMALLYSKGARKVLIKISKTWDKKDKFYKILRIILKKNYKLKDKKLVQNYFNTMKPEIILFKLLYKFNKSLAEGFKEKLKSNISNLGFNSYFIIKMLKYLNINYLDITYLRDKDISLINMNEYVKLSIKDSNKNKLSYDYNNFFKLSPENHKKNINDELKKNPDILILFHTDLHSIAYFINIIYNYINKNYPEYSDINNSKTYNINNSSIRDYNDIIEFNGSKYKLDSCLLNNYNNNVIGHVIAGITCNKKRYVYNGWTSNSIDPALNHQSFNNNKELAIPCSLMEFDWNVKKDVPFCLDPKCSLYFNINEKKHCFSFNKGERILIYVKMDDKKTGSITSLSNYSIDKKDISKMIDDIYNIKNLSEENIKIIIKMLKIKDYHNKKQIVNILKEKYGIIKEIIDKKKHNKEEDIKEIIDKKKHNKEEDIKENYGISKKSVYHTYKHLKDFKGTLLKQQVFLSSFIINNYENIDKFLLYHGIGTGKTCTSITIAETIIENHKEMKILVILPARLKTNYIDELISANCGGFKYISKSDYEIYMNNTTSNIIKSKIRNNFIKKINEYYDIISYEKLRNILIKSDDIQTTIKNLTLNKIIIIDEIHNLITSKVDPNILEKIITNNKIPKNIDGINAFILRLLTKLGDNSSKFFFLSATPVFDNYGQFIQLILNLKPNLNYNYNNFNTKDLKFLINQIKGKVSFYKLNDLSQFPSIKIDNILIPLSYNQAEHINKIRITSRDDNNDDEKSNSFCIYERQLSISVYNKSKKDLIFSDLNEYAPKIAKLVELLKLDGKHLVYSNFIDYCLELIAIYLENNGWNNYLKSNNKSGLSFVIWDASLNDEKKQLLKNIINSKDNIDGSIIKVILGSPSIKEGISFKHIQHLHQIDPVWNYSAKEQIEGRCIRFKSHDEIPKSHKTLKRKVIIHNYISVAPKNDRFNIDETCDEKIYFTIMEEKYKIIKNINELLRKISIDYYLWNTDKSPKSSISSNISITRQEKELNLLLNKKKADNKKEKKPKNTCPSKRRPHKNICSNEYPYIKINKQGFKCCYKKK